MGFGECVMDFSNLKAMHYYPGKHGFGSLAFHEDLVGKLSGEGMSFRDDGTVAMTPMFKDGWALLACDLKTMRSIRQSLDDAIEATEAALGNV